jgi:hypothetical protein
MLFVIFNFIFYCISSFTGKENEIGRRNIVYSTDTNRYYLVVTFIFIPQESPRIIDVTDKIGENKNQVKQVEVFKTEKYIWNFIPSGAEYRLKYVEPKGRNNE